MTLSKESFIVFETTNSSEKAEKFNWGKMNSLGTEAVHEVHRPVISIFDIFTDNLVTLLTAGRPFHFQFFLYYRARWWVNLFIPPFFVRTDSVILPEPYVTILSFFLFLKDDSRLFHRISHFPCTLIKTVVQTSFKNEVYWSEHFLSGTNRVICIQNQLMQ